MSLPAGAFVYRLCRAAFLDGEPLPLLSFFGTCYWISEKSGSEIDFLIQNEMSIVPIEVKAEVNLQAKSLKFYCLKFRPPVAIRTSMGKYYKQTISFSETSDVHASEGYTLIDLPLYAISRIQQECAMISDK